MILSVCGILLSSSFVILFFLLKEENTTRKGPVLALFGTAGFLLAAATASVLSALPSRPSAIYGKIEMIDALMHMYAREYRRAIAAAIFLFVALTGFVTALVMFSWQYLAR